MARAACLPFCMATQGLTSRQGLRLRFPLALEHGKMSPTPDYEAHCVARENTFSSQTNAYNSQGPVNSREFQGASRQHEWSYQNG